MRMKKPAVRAGSTSWGINYRLPAAGNSHFGPGIGAIVSIATPWHSNAFSSLIVRQDFLEKRIVALLHRFHQVDLLVSGQKGLHFCGSSELW
jgi:hypothetical protein